MNIPYRHRRTLKRLGILLAALALVFSVTWLCWVVWLQRYVIYTDDGAQLNFSLSSYEITGKEAVKPQAQQNVSIFYNEGADAIDTTHEMTQLNGYYITSDMFQQDIDYVMLQVERFPSGTPVMIDMKGAFGSFFYNSNLPDAVMSASTNLEQVSKLITRLHTKGFYTIARISAFRDRSYGESHVSSGLYMLNRKGLWMDPDGMYWLDPTNATTTSWITSQVLELRDLGFDEVVLDNFCFPNSDKYIFNGDKAAALQSAAATLVSTCGSNKFVLSFAADPGFILPEGRCRLYVKGVSAAGIGQAAAQNEVSEPELRLVFLAESGDTRFEKYSVLRSLHVAEEVEARKNNESE